MPERRVGLLLAALLAIPAFAQPPAPAPPPADAAADAAQAPPPAAARERYSSPWRAYEEGAFDQALEGFVDRQVARPEDPALALNVGAAHFKMRNWEEAERGFSRAALAGEPDLRAEALYNLGNVAYRQGKLEEAVERYKAALEVDPDDEDAKFNLEFVRDEIRRRHEEAEKRQEQQDQQQQQESQEGESEREDGSEGDPQQQPGEPEQQQNGEEQEGDSQPQQQPGESSPPAGPDQDRDGLSDEIEREGDNPTDPQNPDTDGDGLPDGAEDVDRDGQVDPGETDPNLADTDGDGIPDGAERQAGTEAAAGEAVPPEGLTPEEAARYLQALEEGRPDQRRAPPGRRARPEKDW